MTDPSEPFGRLVVRMPSVADFVALEERERWSDQFIAIDALVANILSRSLRGERVLALERGRESTTVTLLGLDAAQRRLIDERFALSQQQARGAWFLPETATLDAGWANLPFYFAAQPRFATGIAAEERGKVLFHGSADALLTWSVLEPLFECVFRPLALRGPLLGKKDRTWQVKAWEEVDASFAALGFDVAAALAPLRYGGGWSTLDARAHVEAKQTLLAALADQVAPIHAARYRATQVQRLLKRYYQQAKREPPKLRQVLTKDLQRVIAGYFEGDWLAFLAYAEEEPHPDERIAAALPEPRLMVANRDRVTAVAAAQGLPVAEVERALRAFWGSVQELSPVDERVAVLRDIWHEFDVIHGQQVPGKRPLWGLIDEGHGLAAGPPYYPGLYRALFSPNLLGQIERLWGTCMLPRWPERIVSTISPHAAMAEAFGPGLKFWHSCALTAWFVCEGPMSRTDLPGLAAYARSELAELARLNCPVDPSLFAELTRAEAQLGPAEPISRSIERERQEIAPGISLTIEMSAGSRRAGFELLRDIISRHRRAWAAAYLDAYLRIRWETEIRDAARDFGLLHERKGRPPSAKQFGTHAASATNHWFGGDISGLYRMIGEKAPVNPVRTTVMPVDREALVRRVLAHLNRVSQTVDSPAVSLSGSDEREREKMQWDLQWLAQESLDLMQREEALGRPATLTEFGRERFAYRAAGLAPDVEVAWARYQQATESGKGADHLVSASQEVGTAFMQPSVASDDAPVQPLEPRAERRSWWKRLLYRE